MNHQQKLVRAVNLSLKVWIILRDNPDIIVKTALPDYILNKVCDMTYYCPLCNLFERCDVFTKQGTKRCPLYPCQFGKETNKGSYEKWCTAQTKIERGQAAGEIVDTLKNWKKKRGKR